MYVALPPAQRNTSPWCVVSVFADTLTRLPYQPIDRIYHLRRQTPSHQCAEVGGPPPGSRKKIFFFAGRPQKKLCAKVNVFARPRLQNRQSLLTLMLWQTTPSARIASSCTWESVHVSTIRHDAYYCECHLVGGILIRPNPGE